jgi:hypothetical protein
MHLSLQKDAPFGVMCAEQGACVRRRSWAGCTINMFEFEFPTRTGDQREISRQSCDGHPASCALSSGPRDRLAHKLGRRMRFTGRHPKIIQRSLMHGTGFISL